MTRQKGRDLYDLRYLLSKGTEIRKDMLRKKLAHYDMQETTNADSFERIASFPKKDFILDLRPFVPLSERDQLSVFFDILQEQIRKALMT